MAMNINLDIYTEDRVLKEMCILYWEPAGPDSFAHKTSELAAHFKISTSKLKKLVDENCTAYSTQFACSNCGAPRPFKTRTDFTTNQNYFSWDSWVCNTCVNIQREERKRLAETENERKYKILDDEYQNKRKSGLDPSCFSFSDAIYFISLIRVGMSEDLEYLFPRESYERQLSPTSDSDLEILRQLYRNGLICIHPGSRTDSLEINKDTPDSLTFYPLQVHWLLPLSDNQTANAAIAQIESVLRAKESWSEEWVNQSLLLRKEIALQESFQYLKFVLQEHGFDFSIGEKTTQIIKSLLNDFSVAQIYSLCWRAAKDAAAYYMRESVSKKQAANIVPGSIQRMAEKALSEGWEVKPYGRNFKVPQTMVSEVLYNMALQIGDAGFNAVIPKA